mmetsp:Transcript_78876/g.218191  ORF Transcript_78876/g.218191 Transcript_78876/m.218191 type:complete len:585 (+) Transcript_78876:47-1801(+)
MRRLLGSASAPLLPPLAPSHGAGGGTPAVADRASLRTPPSRFVAAKSPADAEWEAAAYARRKIGSKPRKRRPRRRSLPAIREKSSKATEEESGDARSCADDGSDSSGSDSERLPPVRRSSSLSSMLSWMRHSMSGGTGSNPTGERCERNQSILNVHKVSRRRSASEDRQIPMPEIAPGFASVGDFVQHHRGAQERHDVQTAEECSSQPSSARSASSRSASKSPALPPIAGTPQAESDDAQAESPNALACEFHEAVRCNDIVRVRRILASGLDFPVDTVNDDGDTAALAAARAGRGELCAALLDGKADPLARDAAPESFGDGVWPNERRCPARRTRPPAMPGAKRGMTVVYHLRQRKCFDKVLECVFPMTRVSLVRAISSAIQAYHCNPALVVAVQQGNAHLAALLLAHSSAQPLSSTLGARAVHASPYWSATRGGVPVSSERAGALLVACTHREWRCAEVVLAAGVSTPNLDITCDPSGRTAMHLAAAAGQVHTVQLLLRAGASLTIFSAYGRQPLHDACVAGHTPVVRALVEQRADPLVKAREGGEGIPWLRADAGRTAAQLAEARGHSELYSYLLTCHRSRD